MFTHARFQKVPCTPVFRDDETLQTRTYLSRLYKRYDLYTQGLGTDLEPKIARLLEELNALPAGEGPGSSKGQCQWIEEMLSKC